MTELDNVDKLRLRLEKLAEFVIQLKEYQGTTPKELTDDFKKGAIVERLFAKAGEAVLDISRLVVTDQQLPVPENSKGYILALAKAGILEQVFAEKFAKIAGFRNILVHMYLDIDYGVVAENLDSLEDFNIFARSIAQYYELRLSAHGEISG